MPLWVKAEYLYSKRKWEKRRNETSTQYHALLTLEGETFPTFAPFFSTLGRGAITRSP